MYEIKTMINTSKPLPDSVNKIEINIKSTNLLIVYDGNEFSEALREAKVHRSKGINVQLMRWQENKTRDDYDGYAKNHGISQVIYLTK